MKTWQQPLPPIYRKLSDAELRVRIQLAKEALGPKLAILGHHYQQDAVIDALLVVYEKEGSRWVGAALAQTFPQTGH